MILWLLSIAGLGLSGWGALSTWRTLHPRPKPFTGSPDFTNTRTVSLISYDGKPFELLLLEAAAPPLGVLVGCHGYSASRLQLLGLAQGLRQRGYTVILFDLRGHGARLGSCTFGFQDAEDVGAILRWVRQRPAWAACSLGVFGFSLGSGIACHTASSSPECKALVMDSGYDRFFPILALAIRRRYHLPAFPWAWTTWFSIQLALRHRLALRDPLRLARRCTTPLLLIHGTQDQTVPLASAQRLYAAWQGPKEQWIEPQAGHVGSYGCNPEGYCDRVANFFNRWLPAEPRSSPS